MKRFLVLVIGIGFLATSLTGCGSSAASSDTLTIYSGRAEQLVKPVIEKFTKATGIKTEVRYADSAALAAQLLEEGDNTRADVFWSQDAGALGAISKAGNLSVIPQNLLDVVPANLRSHDGNWVGVSARARVIAYNSTEVTPDEVPKSIWDVTDEKWKGEVGYAPTNASFQSFVTAMRLTQGEVKAKMWLEAFKRNDPVIYPNNLRALNGVDDGDVKIALVNHYYLYELQAEVGANRVTARNAFIGNGDPGAMVNVAGVGVLKTTKKTELAQRFVEYLLSNEAQQYFKETTFEYPVIQGMDPVAGLPPLNSIGAPNIDLGNLDSLAATQAMLREVGMI